MIVCSNGPFDNHSWWFRFDHQRQTAPGVQAGANAAVCMSVTFVRFQSESSNRYFWLVEGNRENLEILPDYTISNPLKIIIR